MASSRELISVITPVYNVEKYLPECLDSILSQTYDYFELLLIDDGSSDTSGNICDEYALNDSRITVIHKENGGVATARNLGISQAKGEYICFVDSDDILASAYLQSLYETTQKTGAPIVMCNYCLFIDGEAVPDGIEPKTHENIVITEKEMEDETFSAENTVKVVIPINKIYKKSLFDKVKYPSGKIHEDAFVYHRLLHEAREVILIPDVLYYYRKRADSITNSRFTTKELEDSMGAVIDRIDFYKEQGNQRLVDIAIDGYLYFLWRNIDIMKKDDIKDYKVLIKPYIKIFREKIRLLKVSKDYPLKKLLKMYYIAYFKTDF